MPRQHVVDRHRRVRAQRLGRGRRRADIFQVLQDFRRHEVRPHALLHALGDRIRRVLERVLRRVVRGQRQGPDLRAAVVDSDGR